MGWRRSPARPRGVSPSGVSATCAIQSKKTVSAPLWEVLLGNGAPRDAPHLQPRRRLQAMPQAQLTSPDQAQSRGWSSAGSGSEPRQYKSVGLMAGKRSAFLAIRNLINNPAERQAACAFLPTPPQDTNAQGWATYPRRVGCTSATPVTAAYFWHVCGREEGEEPQQIQTAVPSAVLTHAVLP